MPNGRGRGGRREGGAADGSVGGNGVDPGSMKGLIAPKAVNDTDPSKEHRLISYGVGEVREEEEEGRRVKEEGEGEGEWVLPEKEGGEEDKAHVVLLGEPCTEP